MLKEITEQEFLSMMDAPIRYIGIYELDWLMDDNVLDCEGIIIAFNNRRILVSSKEIGEETYDFIYFECPDDYDCRKIVTYPDEQIVFIKKRDEEYGRYLYFELGKRPINVFAEYIRCVTVALSHWNLNDEWVDFENDNLLD